MLERITPLILTYNEEANLRRLLQSLAWARRVVVVDSESTDGTRAIAAEFSNAKVVVRKFDELARQWNYGLAETGIRTDWVLALDADYVLLPAFVEELARLEPAGDVGGYRASFRYCIEGKPLHGGLYPPVTVLFRREGATFRQDGHAHRVSVAGRVEMFTARLLHDDRKPMERWFSSQVSYMRLEATKLIDTPMPELSIPDRIRRLIVVAPALVFFYCLLVKGNLLDGRRGFLYAMQRFVAEVILSAYIVEAGMRQGRAGEE